MSEILRQDLAKENISASVLAPWIVNTPIFNDPVACTMLENRTEGMYDALDRQFGGGTLKPWGQSQVPE